MFGGKRASAANIQRKKKSGTGEVCTMVGSGGPFGPNGPKTAAQTTSARMMMPGKDEVLAKSIGDEGDSVLLCFFVIFLEIGFAFHQATRAPAIR